jgi:hypothetical protein
LAAIDLNLVNISESSSKSFILSTPGDSDKDIFLKASSNEEAEEWVTALQELKGTI